MAAARVGVLIAMVALRPVGPTTVAKAPGGTGLLIPGTGVFGSAPQWGDNSDASGAVVSASLAGGTDAAYDMLPAAPVAPDAVTGLTVTARVAVTVDVTDLSPNVTVNLFAPGLTSVVGDIIGTIAIPTPIPSGPLDVDMSLASLLIGAGLDPIAYAREVARWLAEASRPIYVTATGVFAPDIVLATTIYEITVDLAGAPGPAPRADLHPVRRYPRDDGTGMSSAPRLYPPPRSARVFGGHQ